MGPFIFRITPIPGFIKPKDQGSINRLEPEVRSIYDLLWSSMIYSLKWASIGTFLSYIQVLIILRWVYYFWDACLHLILAWIPTRESAMKLNVDVCIKLSINCLKRWRYPAVFPFTCKVAIGEENKRWDRNFICMC